MTELFFHPDLVRFAFVLGVVASILLYERRQLTTGGIAVPGYLAFAPFLPLLAPAVIVIALATWAIVHRGIARWIPLSAAARFSLLIVVSAMLHLAVDLAALVLLREVAAQPLLRGIGYVVPGLIAHDFARHGVGRSLGNILLATALVAAALVLAALAVPEVGRLYPSPVGDPFPIGLDWVPLVVLLGLVGWLGLARRRSLRCGGFVGGAYLALLVLQPVELASFAVLAAVTLGVTRMVLEPTMILFGRRRFAAVLLTGAVLSWGLWRLREVWLDGATVSAVTPSLAVIGVLLTGLLASDIDRAGLPRTLLGLGANAAFTLAGTLLAAELVHHGRPEVALPLGLAFAGLALAIFAPLPRRRPARRALPAGAGP